jgi:hypothetical protein
MNSGSVSFQGPDGGFRLYTMVPEVPTYPAGCVAGENACPICALSIIKCPQVYAGVPGFSTATDPIGFPGRIGSCAYDSVGDCLFTVRKNLTPANATVFDVRHPCIGSILDNMERGAISNWGGKKLLEEEIHRVLYGSNAYTTLCNHGDLSTGTAYLNFRPRLL